MALHFDERFYERPIEKQLDYLLKLCDSQNDALDIMQKERNAALVRAKALQESLNNAELAFTQQKDIVKNLVTKSNADNQSTGERIRDLERKIEELGGNINCVGN